MVYVWLLFLLIIILVFFVSPKSTNQNHNLPPSPSISLPVIGHLHLLAYPPCRSLFRLSHSLGPIFSLRFGSRLVIVISSASIAEECFTHNDVVFANRPPLLATDHVSYNSSTVASASYGSHWRFLRRTISTHLFSPSRINSFAHIQSEAVAALVRNINNNIHSSDKKAIAALKLRPLLKEMMFKIMMRILTGEEGDLGFVIDTMDDLSKLFDKIDAAEVLSLLRVFDFGRYERKLKKAGMALDALLQGILDERRQKCKNGGREDNVIDNLLQMQRSDPCLYDDVMIKGLILVVLTGTIASVVNMEWTMSLLLNHPTILSKAKKEIDVQVGEKRPVNHSDLQHLPYLHNIISETLRLYPSTPLLIPRYSSRDCRVAGYRIPSNTMVLVNTWAIHRDPDLWNDPLVFRPERFEGRDVNVYEFMPFGVGRRACPGFGFAKPVVAVALASLIQCFEWERCSGEEMDMTEEGGLNLIKAKPFEAVCKAGRFLSSSYA